MVRTLTEVWKWRDILWFAGGIALFMYGMYQMGEGLARLAGGRLAAFLGRVAKSPAKAVAAGAGVTAVLQSSSAVTVMVVQFVNAGMMGLRQAAGVIMGANIGTCVTAWMLGVPEVSRYLFVVALVAAALVLWRGSSAQKWSGAGSGGGASAGAGTHAGAKDAAGTLLGAALLFLGMDGMQAGTAALAESAQFQRLLMRCSDPLQGLLTGALVTAVIQSSSVSVGILQALSAGGAMRYETAIPVILGQNIGTCVTALLACIGVGARGRAAAAVHLAFNVAGTGIFLFGFYGLHRIVGFPFMSRPVHSVGIAVIHTAFNLVTTVVLLPFLYDWGEADKKTTAFRMGS